MGDTAPARLVVVVPARDEEPRLAACLSSLAAQVPPPRVLVSDNASQDATRAVAESFADRLDLTVRTTGPLGPSEHFVSAGRWALTEEPDAAAYAFLAGDDEWLPGFTDHALAALSADPGVGAVFPAFVWTGGDDPDRLLAPCGFPQPEARARQRRALLLPDRRELANLVYGVLRRDAFRDLVTSWERGGDAFAADYAAAWCLVGRHRVVAEPAAVGRRHVRRGADLVERVAIRRGTRTDPVSQGLVYLRLNLRVNRLIGQALAAADLQGAAPAGWQVQLLRAPQWVAGAWHQLAGRRRASGAAAAPVVGAGAPVAAEAGPDGAHQGEGGEDGGEGRDGRAEQRTAG